MSKYNWNDTDHMEEVHISELHDMYMEDLMHDLIQIQEPEEYDFKQWLDDQVRNGYLVHGDDDNYYREI